MGVMDDSVGRESTDHKWDSYQKHDIKVVTKLSRCCIDENRKEGAEPVYVTTTDKHGNKTERFYVRSGNSSQEIQSLKEITEYVSKKYPT